MKKKILGAAALLAACLMLFSACDYTLLSPEQLMRPPQYYGENEGLQDIFSSTAGANAILKAPYEGAYRSAFILEDIDGDGSEEALAFYVKNLDKNVCRMMLFEKSGGNWTLCANIRGEGSEVVSVSLADLDQDGVQEIIVGWGTSGGSDRVLSVYRYSPEQRDVRSLASEPYRLMACLDVDGDRDLELFVVSTASASSATATSAAGGAADPARFRGRLLKIQETIQPSGMQDVSITSVSEIALSSAAVDCTQLMVQQFYDSNEPLAFFLDCASKDSGLFTDVITWSNGRLNREEFAWDRENVYPTYRSANITCQDINADGYIEIPAQIPLDGSSNPAAADANSQSADSSGERVLDEQISLTVWRRFSQGKLTPVANSVINFSDSYLFLFKGDWTAGAFPRLTNNVTVAADLENRIWSFYDYDYSTKVRGRLIFEIIVHPVGTDISGTDEIEIISDNTLIYTVRLGPEASSRSVSYGDIVNSFVLLSD